MLFEVELDKNQRKKKERKNTKKPNIWLLNTYDKEKPRKEVDVELMNMRNVPSKLKNQGLWDDKIRLFEEVKDKNRIDKNRWSSTEFKKPWED